MPARGKLWLVGSAFGLGAGAATAAAARIHGGRPAITEPPPPPAPIGPSPKEIVDTALVEALLSRPAPGRRVGATPVTDALYGRLTDQDHADIAAAMEGEAMEIWDSAPDYARRRLALTFAAHYGLEGALAHTGLTSAAPPDDVHAMARGPLAAGGDPGIADLVMGRLEEAGLTPPEGGRILDFGCSSGRVLRTIAAARPDLVCVGCDPNENAIAWAQENLPMARFFGSPTSPRLPVGDGTVDSVYAISVWSHFDAEQALLWLAEMHRIVKPGGGLLLTTHGLDALADFLRPDRMTHDSAAEVALKMLGVGHHWFDVFGEDGDWGVKAPGWGNAFLSMEWLLGHVTPDWSLRLLVPGGLDENQDVVVLERR